VSESDRSSSYTAAPVFPYSAVIVVASVAEWPLMLRGEGCRVRFGCGGGGAQRFVTAPDDVEIKVVAPLQSPIQIADGFMQLRIADVPARAKHPVRSTTSAGVL